MASPKKPKVERQPGRGLEVRSFAEQFRRCGRAFTREATVIPLSDLTDDELELLNNEPALAVKEVDLPDAVAGA